MFSPGNRGGIEAHSRFLASLGMTKRRGWLKGKGRCQGGVRSCVEGTRCLPVHSSLNLPQASRLLPRLAGAGGMTNRRGLLKETGLLPRDRAVAKSERLGARGRGNRENALGVETGARV